MVCSTTLHLGLHWFQKYMGGSFQDYSGERSGSVVECMTLDGGAAGPSLTGVTALCP